ncbi:MAG: type VI secretion system protein TssA [Alphaproteobacteria bacterium]|nr:type VI secretion system protein TssA [Alphaproteobacteria bacterium]
MIDLDAILKPISDAHPTGDDLRYEGTYDRIREARREDDASLPAGVWQTKLKKADWAEVRRASIEALTAKSKDLQIAAWHAEALVNLEGYAGIADGLMVCDALCRTFWDKLYPRIEGDDLEARVLPMAWLNDKLIVELQKVPLTQPGQNQPQVYSWSSWEHALRLDQLANRDRKAFEKAEAEGEVTRVRFMAAASQTADAFYGAMASDIAKALSQAEELTLTLDEKCGRQAPSLSRLANYLVAVHELIASFLRERGAVAPTLGQPPAVVELGALAASAPGGAGEGGTAVAVSASGPIRSREDAYQRMREAAEYLLRTEPHSPTPYLVRRAVSWGSMPLADLLREIVRDENDLAQLYRLLGMNAPTKAK